MLSACSAWLSQAVALLLQQSVCLTVCCNCWLVLHFVWVLELMGGVFAYVRSLFVSVGGITVPSTGLAIPLTHPYAAAVLGQVHVPSWARYRCLVGPGTGSLHGVNNCRSGGRNWGRLRLLLLHSLPRRQAVDAAVMCSVVPCYAMLLSQLKLSLVPGCVGCRYKWHLMNCGALVGCTT